MRLINARLHRLLLLCVVWSLWACHGHGADDDDAPMPAPPPPPNGNANLAALAVGGATLTPVFQPSRSAYDATVGFLTDSVAVTPTADDPNATVALNGTAIASSNTRAVTLAEGANTIDVRVTATNGTAQTYSLAIWRQPASSFVPDAYIKASNPRADDRFGASIAVQGNTLVVGAPAGLEASGRAYVFQRDSAGVWHQEAVIGGGNGAVPQTGTAVAIDGDTIVVSDPREPCDGALYVFVRSATGTWSREATISPPLPRTAGCPTELGIGVSVALAGGVIAARSAVGIHVFERVGAAWTQTGFLAPPGRSFDPIALYGTTIVVGAPTDSSSAVSLDNYNGLAPNSGAVYVFGKSSTGAWAQEAYLKASNNRSGAYFGAAVRIEGNRLAVGAPGESSAATGVNGDQSDGGLQFAGAAYLFERSAGGTWSQSAYFKAPTTAAGAFFGARLALSANRLAVPGAGAFHLFARAATGAWVPGPTAPAAGRRFAYIAMDGDTVVASDPNEDGSSSGIDGPQIPSSASASSGAVYVYGISSIPDVNATLSSLDSFPSELDQAFQPNQFNYTTTGNFLPNEVVLRFSTGVTSSKVFLNGRLVEREVTLPLAPGSNRYAFDVLAEDGRSTLRYTLDVTRPIGASSLPVTYVKASNPDANDQFGTAVAFDGSTLVVGAPHESSAGGTSGGQSDNSAPDSGAVYVYVRESGGGWKQQAFVKAWNAKAGDLFGTSVAIDGDRLLVGAPGTDGHDGLTPDAGGAYLFKRLSSGEWVPAWYMQRRWRAAGDLAGTSVALRGRYAFVGAPGAGHPPEFHVDAPFAGAVSWYIESRGDWSQEGFVLASNPETGDRFGSSLAFDGITLAVGAPYEDGVSSGVNGFQADGGFTNSGAVYLFGLLNGTSWIQIAYVKASNTGANDRFGTAVAVNGSVLAVGAPGESGSSSGIGGDQLNDLSPSSGAVYLYGIDASGHWQSTMYIKQPDTAAGDEFGSSVALLPNVLAAGLLGHASTPGLVHVYREGAPGEWSWFTSLLPPSGDPLDRFGASLAAGAARIVVAAPGEDGSASGGGGNQSDNGAPDAGAVYVFE